MFLNLAILESDGWYFHCEILPDLYILSFQHVGRVEYILPQLWHMKHRKENWEETKDSDIFLIKDVH